MDVDPCEHRTAVVARSGERHLVDHLLEERGRYARHRCIADFGNDRELLGRDAFDVESARTLLRQMEEGKAAIRAEGHFSNAAARDRVLNLYDDGIRDLTDRINQRTRLDPKGE